MRPRSASALPQCGREPPAESRSPRGARLDQRSPARGHATCRAGRFDACLAEFQSAGRGRRGRRWLAPFASGLCLSVNWNFRDAPAALGALSLAIGVAILRALRRHRVHGLALKWPNDIVHGRRKLGGILIDMRGEAAGPAYVVVGCGINVRLPQGLRAELQAEGDRGGGPANSLDAPPGAQRARAASIVNEIALALEEFGAARTAGIHGRMAGRR